MEELDFKLKSIVIVLFISSFISATMYLFMTALYMLQSVMLQLCFSMLPMEIYCPFLLENCTLKN